MEEPETAEALRREIAALRARKAELVSALGRAEQRVQRLERIIEVVPGAVWESEGTPGEPGYRMPYVSGEVERIFGYTREECLRRANFWTSITHPDDVPTVVRELEETATTGGRLSEFRFITKDGGSVWVEAHITLNRDASGAIVGRCVVAPDVTDRVLLARSRAELLARSEALAQKLDSLIASVPGVVWEVQQREPAAGGGREIVFVSDYFTTLLGYPTGDLIARQDLWTQVVHPEDLARVMREIGRIYAEGQGSIPCRWVTRDGRTLWVEIHVSAVRDEGGAVVGAYGVTMDITAQKLAEEERDRLKDQVIVAQEATLLELRTPIIPLSSEVLVMPLVGAIDAARSAQVIDALLAGVARWGAKVAILDVTGARRVGAETAEALLRAARAARLLGAEVVLTGVSAEAAMALVDLGADLEGLSVHASLEGGIAYATRRG